MVRENGTGPVRLFDRKKTRAAQKNGSDRSLVGIGSSRPHANGNGAGSDLHAPYIVGNPMNQNGHSPNGKGAPADDPASREKVGAHSPADGE